MNKSGLFPVEFKILVKLDTVGEKSAGGIIIPATLRDKQQMVQVEATLIAYGGNAFEDWKGPTPKVGDHIYVGRAAGYQVRGVDGKKYQLMNDKDIAAIITEAKA